VLPILVATSLSLLLSLLGAPLMIDVLRARGVGQLIREDGPSAHFVKHGTPTMGGFVVLLSATLAYIPAHFVLTQGRRELSAAAILVLAVAWGLGLLGAIDDLTKIRRRRSLGLNKRAKLIGQAVVAVGLTWAAVSTADVTPTISWAGLNALPWVLPIGVFAVWVFIMIAGGSNAVNLTDGLDGLACGAAAMAFFVFTIIAFWEFRNPTVYTYVAGRTATYQDIAVVAAAFLGACIGFLWWNAAPARIFMGDTGSLSLGGALAALAIVTRTQLLLLVIGALFVIETVSVILQVVAYRGFNKRRVFAMAPLHHHFELRGWAEFTVIVRFWIVAALAAGFGLGLFYQMFLYSGGGQ
jgi:phospho-N-acetylmuramoyl-pentapeptide-transferase